MLRINRDQKTLKSLDKPSLAAASLTERYDLQEFIWNSPEAFFSEIGQELFLVGKELQPSDDVEDRIDLLALDKEGNAVVIELKRGNNRSQLFQAISYAGMVAKWAPGDFLKFDESRREAIENFLEVDSDEINRTQRILLIAEDFDYSVLVGAEWLSEQHGVDLSCCRLSLARDTDGNGEFLVCSNVFPAPELAEQSIRRRRGITGNGGIQWPNWEAALDKVSNQDAVAFYKARLAANQNSRLERRTLIYEIGGKRRLILHCRTKNVYVWQRGRFDGDIDFWRKGLSDKALVKSVKGGRCLSFSLVTRNDFDFIQTAYAGQLQAVPWTYELDPDDPDHGELA